MHVLEQRVGANLSEELQGIIDPVRPRVFFQILMMQKLSAIETITMKCICRSSGSKTYGR